MFEGSLFAEAAREFARLHRADAPAEPGAAILSRRAMRLSSPAMALRERYDKLRGRRLHFPGAISGRA